MNPRQVEQSYSDRSRNRRLVPAGKDPRKVSQSESRSYGAHAIGETYFRPPVRSRTAAGGRAIVVSAWSANDEGPAGGRPLIGTGHSLPGRTAHLLIGDVQIGRSFVLHIVADRNCPAVTDAALQRAGALEPAVAGEGVEDRPPGAAGRGAVPVRWRAGDRPVLDVFGPQTGRWGAGGQA